MTLSCILLCWKDICKAKLYGLDEMNSLRQSSNLIGLAVIQKCYYREQWDWDFSIF